MKEILLKANVNQNAQLFILEKDLLNLSYMFGPGEFLMNRCPLLCMINEDNTPILQCAQKWPYTNFKRRGRKAPIYTCIHNLFFLPKC